MERKIGEIFEYKGKWYQCVNGFECTKCDLHQNKRCTARYNDIGSCSKNSRKDNTPVIFNKLEKVGEPYLAHDHSRNKDVVVQDYKLHNQHACYNGHEKMLSFGFRGRNEIVTIKSKEPIQSLNCENSVEIQIEQNKEDMEANEKTIPVPEGWEFDRFDECGNIVLKKKKKELPKMWLKCLYSINDVEM